ncbi:uncharacterized protein LOC110730075 [Chenopodium quinoa]|uniref:Uncharacterized protein n=1 Tax=Chenopodium quinoa TaxID=63459 RepID=A0A803LTQ6_CHEQI|nr:uncharacterized protein LOC110730075 [Chenopodium quinoa]
MDFFLNKMKETASECPYDEQDIQQCPFLRNISKPTNLSFAPVNLPVPAAGSKGPIFEDGPNFDLAFNLFHGKDGVVPLTRRPNSHADDHLEPHSSPMFNPLATKAATISLSAFGLGGPFGFNFFSDKWKKQKQKSESSGKKDRVSHEGNPAEHEALSNEWLQSGNCPIAKSYRAVGHVLPLVAKALQPPSGMKLHCPPAIVAARAALARTAFVKNLRPQPLPAKMLCIAALGMAANVPLGIWREHTQKFSLSWFIAVHAAVPFVAMLRKAVLMPKTAMALTIGASILGQVIGSRAERIRMNAVTENQIITSEKAAYQEFPGCSTGRVDDSITNSCGNQQVMFGTLSSKHNNAGSSGTNVCF